MWKTERIETREGTDLDTLMAALEARVPTGYGPWPSADDFRGVAPEAEVIRSYSYTRHDVERLPNGCGWRAIYRMGQLPRLAEAMRKVGVDPSGVYLTMFDQWISTAWVESKEDADKLRLAWAREHDVTPESAERGVVSPHIGEDQRAMYQAVLDCEAA